MTGKSRIPCASAEEPASGSSVANGHNQTAKEALRCALRAKRRGLDPATKAEWDRRIGAQLLRWWQQSKVAALGVYWPLYGEPDLRATYAGLAGAGVRLALPVVVARDAALAFAAWTPGETMVKDGMGVAVPGDLHFVERPPALLVPCLGFNAQNFRLGYGGGYYDRTLAEAPRPYTLGIAYAHQEAAFAGDAHDVALDLIVTEATCFK
jgi:5,10-methenyltetrahydrofolate synthetase